LTFYKKNFEKITSEADFFETELFFLLIWGGRLALRHHRSFSATSYCWL